MHVCAEKDGLEMDSTAKVKFGTVVIFFQLHSFSAINLLEKPLIELLAHFWKSAQKDKKTDTEFTEKNSEVVIF